MNSQRLCISSFEWRLSGLLLNAMTLSHLTRSGVLIHLHKRMENNPEIS